MRDGSFDHLTGAVGFAARASRPFVFAVQEHVKFDLAAGSHVGLTNFSGTAGSTLSSRASCMMGIGTSVTG
jgi:hypothetical protein